MVSRWLQQNVYTVQARRVPGTRGADEGLKEERGHRETCLAEPWEILGSIESSFPPDFCLSLKLFGMLIPVLCGRLPSNMETNQLQIETCTSFKLQLVHVSVSLRLFSRSNAIALHLICSYFPSVVMHYVSTLRLCNYLYFVIFSLCSICCCGTVFHTEITEVSFDLQGEIM